MSRIHQILTTLKPQQAVTYIFQLAWFRLKHNVQTLQASVLLWRWGVSTGRTLSVSGRIRCSNRGKFTLGDHVTLNSGPDRNFVGGDRRVSFWIGKGGNLLLGHNVKISGSTIISMQSVSIGDNTLIGGGCDIYDTDFHEIDPVERLKRNRNIKTSPVKIGANVFVGAHCLILKGTTIGEGAIVGAGSTVVKDIPPYEIWGGNPARKIRDLYNDTSK